MKIPVTSEQITTAKQRDSQHCMIADAIRDRLNATFVSVDIQAIRFSVPAKDTRFVYLTPPEVQRAILAFDKGAPIKPFSFTLNNPVKAMPMQHWSRGTVEQQRQASKKYRSSVKAGKLPPKQKRHHAPREREYGVRILTA